jgi:hypothetical protein
MLYFFLLRFVILIDNSWLDLVVIDPDSMQYKVS